ncbi:MAG: hypothetical protein JST69_02275 [Bacteroidetes bacterium]|nr:hypothetical protein [Bacteroidota bacterium]
MKVERTMQIFLFLFVLLSCTRPTQLNYMNQDIKLHRSPATVGLGTLSALFLQPVPLYYTANDKLPFDTLSFEKTPNGVMLYKTTLLKSFTPYRLSVGDSDKEASAHIKMGLVRSPAALVFRVVAETDLFYQVVLNEKTFETVALKKNQENLIYETWEHLLLRAEYVNFNTQYEVYDKPEGKIIFKKTGREFFPYKVEEIKNEWMKVKKGPGREFNFAGYENAEGWVKWKNEKEIVIRITEYTIE